MLISEIIRASIAIIIIWLIFGIKWAMVYLFVSIIAVILVSLFVITFMEFDKDEKLIMKKFRRVK